MSWSWQEVRELGLEGGPRYAYLEGGDPFLIHGYEVVIDLRFGMLVANRSDDEPLVEALDLPRFETLKELFVWLRLHGQ